MKKKFSDYLSRTSEASRLMNEADDRLGDFFARMGNIFYQVASPIEQNERQCNIRAKIVRAQIKKELYKNTPWVDINANRAGLNSQADAIVAAGLRGVFEVTRTRIQSGKVIGSGHHARQEASANAVIKINQALNG